MKNTFSYRHRSLHTPAIWRNTVAFNQSFDIL
jgi:hypothetical protein